MVAGVCLIVSTKSAVPEKTVARLYLGMGMASYNGAPACSGWRRVAGRSMVHESLRYPHQHSSRAAMP
jgi:hypothetical protein